MIGSRIKIGIILALIAGLGALAWLYRAEIKQSAQLAQTVIQQRADMEGMEKQLAESERQRQRAEDIAEAWEAESMEITAEARHLRKKIAKLERENEKVRHWADTRIPDDLLDLMRHQDDYKN